VLLVAGAVVVGVLVGLALGGSLRNLAHATFRWWPVAIGGLVLQVVPVPEMDGDVDRWLAVGLLVLSYVALLAFVAVNMRLPGMAVLAVGFLLNAIVISVNGGMPVTESALRAAAGARGDAAVRHLEREGGRKHHLASKDDVLTPLADVVPIGPPFGQVVSVGDLLAVVGAAWLVAGVTKRRTEERDVAPSAESEGGPGPGGAGSEPKAEVTPSARTLLRPEG
jgi:Family of unknown function (DUF5317)